MHILLTRCLIEGSSSGVQCMNCPPGQNTVGNSLNRMRKTPPRSDPSLCLSSIKLPQFSFQKTLLCKSSQIARTDPNLTAVFYMHLTSTACSHTPLLTFPGSVFQSTVAAQTPPLSAVRRRGDPPPLGGTPGEAPDQQVTHR